MAGKGILALIGAPKGKSMGEEEDDEDKDAPEETSEDEADATKDFMQALKDDDAEAARVALKRFVMACSGEY